MLDAASGECVRDWSITVYQSFFGGFLLVCTMKLNSMHDVECMVVLSFLWYMSACLKAQRQQKNELARKNPQSDSLR